MLLKLKFEDAILLLNKLLLDELLLLLLFRTMLVLLEMEVLEADVDILDGRSENRK